MTAARKRLPVAMRRPYTGPTRTRATLMSPSPDTLAAALAWLSAQRPAAEALLRRLVEASSHTADPAGVARVVGLLAPGARGGRPGGGAARRRRPLRPAPRPPRAGGPARRPSSSATSTPSSRPATFSGFRGEGDRGFGPGVFDMKGGLVVLRPRPPGGPPGRPAGAPAARRPPGVRRGGRLARLAPAPRAAGPRRPRGALLRVGARRRPPGDAAQGGGGAARWSAHGVAAHAGNEHERGRNAIWALARFVDRAQRLTDAAARRHRQRRHHPRRHLQEHRARAGRVPGGPALPHRRPTASGWRRRSREAAAAAALARDPARARAHRLARSRWCGPTASAALAEAYGACQRAARAGRAARRRWWAAAPTPAPPAPSASPPSTGSGRAAGPSTPATRRWSSTRSCPRRQAFLRYLASLDSLRRAALAGGALRPVPRRVSARTAHPTRAAPRGCGGPPPAVTPPLGGTAAVGATSAPSRGRARQEEPTMKTLLKLTVAAAAIASPRPPRLRRGEDEGGREQDADQPAAVAKAEKKAAAPAKARAKTARRRRSPAATEGAQARPTRVAMLAYEAGPAPLRGRPRLSGVDRTGRRATARRPRRATCAGASPSTAARPQQARMRRPASARPASSSAPQVASVKRGPRAGAWRKEGSTGTQRPPTRRLGPGVPDPAAAVPGHADGGAPGEAGAPEPLQPGGRSARGSSGRARSGAGRPAAAAGRRGADRAPRRRSARRRRGSAGPATCGAEEARRPGRQLGARIERGRRRAGRGA